MQKLDVEANDYGQLSTIMREGGTVIEHAEECEALNSFFSEFSTKTAR